MGQVWAAENTITGRTVALKCIPSSGAYATARSRFLREARAAALLDHPNVVEVLDAFEGEGTWVIVMNLLHGETLAEHLERKGALSVQGAATLLLPVVSALGSAHERGLIHRDVKPENIFLLGDGTAGVKVLDFGIAKFQAAGIATHSSLSVGTPAYMAPEQALQNRDVDCRCDMWSLGVVLYQCLLGRQPLLVESIPQMLQSLRAGGLPPIETQVADVPPDIARLLAEMLAVERDERLSSLARAYDVLAGYTSVRPPRCGSPHPSVIARDLPRSAVAPPVATGAPATTLVLRAPPRAIAGEAADEEKVTSVTPQVLPHATAARSSRRFKGRVALGLLGALGLGVVLLRSCGGAPSDGTRQSAAIVPIETREPLTERAASPQASGERTAAEEDEALLAPAPDRSAPRTRVRPKPRLPIEENPYRFR
jgi:hypothetical protein